jgi:phage gpG-like protein
MADTFTDVLRIVGQLAVRQIQRRIRERRVVPITNKPGTTLMGRGNLLASVRNSARGTSVVITAGNQNVPYARIHHEGGIIRPRYAKYLAIPLTPRAKLFKPRSYPGETLIKNGIIFAKDGDELTPIYALKRQVIMPARPYMFLSPDDSRLIETAVAERIQKDLDRIGEESK